MKTLKRLVCALIIISCCSVMAVSADSVYVQPWTWYDDGNSTFNGGTVISDGKGASGGYNRFGDYVTAATDRDSRLKITSSSGATIQSVTDAAVDETDKHKNYYLIKENGDKSETSNKGNQTGVVLSYATFENNGRMGFNAANVKGGNIYGKATFQFDIKIDKNDFYGKYEDKTRRFIRVFNTNEPSLTANTTFTSSFNMGKQTAAFIELYYLKSWADEGNFAISLGNTYENVQNGNIEANIPKRHVVKFGNWYTIKMEIDVPANSVTYTLLNSVGAVIKTHTQPLTEQSDYVAPVISFDDFKFYGVDYSIDELKITRESFVMKGEGVTVDSEGASATVDVANDVFSTDAPTASPKLILASYNTDGSLKKAAFSNVETIASKSAADSALSYQTLTASLSAADSTDDVRAYIWSSLTGMIPYQEVITPSAE